MLAMVNDPVATELVASLARPGGNLTSVVVDDGLETLGKALPTSVRNQARFFAINRIVAACASRIDLPHCPADVARSRTRATSARSGLGHVCAAQRVWSSCLARCTASQLVRDAPRTSNSPTTSRWPLPAATGVHCKRKAAHPSPMVRRAV
jgi:hypothetical protein